MKRFEIEGTDTVVVLKHGNIENEKADIILNWANQDLKSGPRSFYNIHRKAGPALFNYTLPFEEHVREADAFSTVAGQLDCKLVVHAVIPVMKNAYIKTFYNIAETVKTYKKDNLARSMSVYIPENPNECLAGIKTFLLDVGLREVTVLYLTDKELKVLEKFFSGFKKKHSIWSRMDKIVIGGMTTFYLAASTTWRRLADLRSRRRRSRDSETSPRT